MCSEQTSCGEILAGETYGQECLCWRPSRAPAGGETQTLRPLDARKGGQPCCVNGWARGHRQTAKLWTAATIAPQDCGPKKPEPGQQLPQPCPRKLRPVALAEVLMKLTESFVIEQHIDRLLKSAEPRNLGLGTPGAAAMIVRIVRGWANDRSRPHLAPKSGRSKISRFFPLPPQVSSFLSLSWGSSRGILVAL